MSNFINQFRAKFLDHAHVYLGEFGGWANVRLTAEGMIGDMEAFNISKAGISMILHDIIREAVQRFPGRLIGFIWVNRYEGEKAVDEVKGAANDWGFGE